MSMPFIFMSITYTESSHITSTQVFAEWDMKLPKRVAEFRKHSDSFTFFSLNRRYRTSRSVKFRYERCPSFYLRCIRSDEPLPLFVVRKQGFSVPAGVASFLPCINLMIFSACIYHRYENQLVHLPHGKSAYN